MKKTLLLMLLVIAVGFASCDHKPKPNTNKIDVVLVNKGQISFYNADTQTLTPFEKETDSVVNLLFDDQNHLYYNIAKNKQLSLKMLDLNQEKPEPKHCADWNTTLELAIDFMTGGVSDFYIDEKGENLFIYQLDTTTFFMRPLVYNIKSNKVRMAEDEELFNFRSNNPNCDISHCFSEGLLFYYVTPEEKYCLSDEINFETYFADDDELQELEFNPISLSPDGNSMAYTAAVYWGEGWGYYCVANLDGTMQVLLNNSNIWDKNPQWLDNSTLVYIENVEIPESDPEYDPDWINTRPSIAIFDPHENISKTISLGEVFAIRPKPLPVRKEMQQKDLENCDVAIFDKGKVTFYNSKTKEFIPYVSDDDSIVNGVFVYDYNFYYTVDIGDELYLKQVYLGEYVAPLMVTSWDLNLDDCVSETYGKVSPLVWIKAFDRVGINHNFSWDFYNFADIKFYDLMSHEKLDGWSEEENVETDLYDEDFIQFEEDLERFVTFNGNYYYVDDDQEICISDKINFKQFVSDPEYFSEPEFEILAIDPTRKLVAYVAYIEWGDLGHGPLCIASLDGKMQKAFGDTDGADLTYGWLSDGALLFVGEEPRPTDDPDYDAEWNTTKACIKIVKPDGTVDVFSHASEFVVIE
jgi:hypothetical protein